MDKYFTVNAEGCCIRARLYAPDRDEIRQVVLFGHGFGGHKDNRAAARFADHVLEKNRNVAVVTFDWPCHGDDVRKVLRLEDCGAYLRIMVAYLNERFHAPQLFAYATSFGGYLFLKAISEGENPFRKMALRCPAVNMYEVLSRSIMTKEALAQLKKGKPALIGFDRKIKIDAEFLESLKQADITRRDYLDQADELLILHGTEDEIVPVEAVKAFAEQNVIELALIERANHRFQDPRKMDQAISRITAFFGMK